MIGTKKGLMEGADGRFVGCAIRMRGNVLMGRFGVCIGVPIYLGCLYPFCRNWMLVNIAMTRWTGE